ncbi:MAG: hypothetical protein ACRD0J_07415 [Acidimicrobiales bacterium]
MSLTADERSRFLASLSGDPAFREEVRRQVLTVELIELPERFAAFVEEMHAFVAEVRAFIAATGRRLDAVERDIGRLQDDSGELKGMALEHKIRANPGYYLNGHGRRLAVVGLDELLEAVGMTGIDGADYAILVRTDLFLRGRAWPSGTPLLFVVEATWRMHTGDVDRQVARRRIFEAHGVEVVPLIASIVAPIESVADRAADNDVVVVVTGPAYQAA